MITPIKSDRLHNWLLGYNKDAKNFLIDGFTFGFKIPFEGKRKFTYFDNLLSARNNISILKEKIAKEVRAGRAAGPFDNPPFQDLQVSPLGLVPKKVPGEFRVIHHLSFPEKSSINDGIPDYLCTVRYQTVDDALRLVKFHGPNCLLAKTDIENSFKIIPIHESCHELLGFAIDGKFYYDKTLPMGLSYSCNLFEKFSTAIHWMVDHKLKSTGCVHVLDDFLFVGPANSSLCRQTLLQFLDMANNIGLPIKEDKTVYPTTTINFLGLEIDTILMEIRLPQDKLTKLLEKLRYLKHRKKVTLEELQSVIGLLNFVCNVVQPGRAFLRRLIDLTIGLKKPKHRRWLTKEARADINAWLVFAENFNGKSLFLSDRWESSVQLNLYTDASNIGFGCVLGTQWFAQIWDGQWLSYHITVRELYPLIIAVELWGSQLKNKCVNFHSDNLAVVHIINKQSSKDKTIMQLVRKFVLLTLKYNILFKCSHIAGIKNIAADYLSRLQIAKFKREFPKMEVHPTVDSVTLLKL